MEVIYAKYNRNRLPEYQTETIIYNKSGELFTQKNALTPSADSHIKSMFNNYSLLKQSMKSILITRAELNEEGIAFDYSNSPLLASFLLDSIVQNNKKLFYEYLTVYKNIIHKQDLLYVEHYESDAAFRQVFKQSIQLKQVYCLNHANIDLTFDNLTLNDGQLTVIDYEWVFSFYMPVSFIMFRAVTEFFNKNHNQMNGFITLPEIYGFLDINPEYIHVFQTMENSFQQYVFGEDRAYTSTLNVTNAVYDLAEIESQNKGLSKELDNKNSELLKKNEELNLKTTEMIQLNENALSLQQAITDKDNQLRLFDQKIEQLRASERELNVIYNSGGWRLLRKYYAARDFVLPHNSRRRLFGKLLFKFIKNPKLLMSNLNTTNIKKLKYYMNAEEAKQLEHRIDSYVSRHTDDAASLKAVQLFQQREYTKLEFIEHADPLVSIVIPVYNQFNYTYSCLASILENTRDIAYEIIIADDMSSDETMNIHTYADHITVVRDGENRGFLLNCNNAAKHARGKYIFFLNNDTNVQSQWLDSLLALIESDPTIGMVGSKLIYPDGRQQEAGGIIWNDASGWNYGRLDDPEKPEYSYVKEVDYISGAAILVKHDLWNRLGGFDERYVPAYFEDTDLAFAIRNLGYKVMLQPQSVIVHFEGISHGTDTGSGIKSYQVTNKEKFWQKWELELTRDHFSNAEHVFLARDRSKSKKTIMIIDHYVPHYDKDAGGRCTYLYMKLMVSMGYRVIFMGDNFFKHEPYTSELQQMGIEVLYGNWYAKNINNWIKTNGQYIDYVYLNRPHIAIKHIEAFKKHTDAKIIYFGHDLHYLREMRNYEITKNPALLKSSEEWKEIEFKLFRLADVIHVVGVYEQQILREQISDKPIRNIPLFPYEQLYSDTHSIPAYNERKDLLFVGGFNHKPNYDGIAWFIDHILPLVKQNIPEIKLYIVGSNPPEDLIERQSENVIITGYVTDEQLENYYNSTRVVVVPLRFGAGVKGKVVEALYYQVPLVTTMIGAEGLADISGVLTTSDQESGFAEAVVHLYENAVDWSAYSDASGNYIRTHFTVEAARSILSLDITNQENSND